MPLADLLAIFADMVDKPDGHCLVTTSYSFFIRTLF